MGLKNFLLLIGLSCCWGPSFLLIKLSLNSFPPSLLVFSRLLLAGLVLTLILRFKKNSLANYKFAIKDFLLIGFFANACPFILISYGEVYIPSSLAAIMNSTTPLFTACIAHFFVTGERLKLHKIFGILLGMTGILVIFLPSFGTLKTEDFFGCFLVLGGSLSYSVSFVLAKKRAQNFPPIVFSAGQLLAASVFLIPFGIHDAVEMNHLYLSSILALTGLSLIGTSLAFVLYHTLIKRTGPTFVSFSSLLFPAAGILLGHFFLGETLHYTMYIGSAMILLGLSFASFYPAIKEKLTIQKKAALD